ncbi:MAG TPA: DUF6069 family protein [Kineosporiaceae bacterium]|nr:DUF6069 family protein [Kineosporiaceae bacterium]
MTTTDLRGSIVDSAGRGKESRSAVRRRVGRAATIGGAAVITTAGFLVVRAAGADFTITDPGQGKVPHTFVPAEIAMVTVVIGLLGWVTLAALERWTRRPGPIWGSLAVGILLLSLVPIWIERATTETRFGLVVVHVAVAIGLLPLWRTAQARRLHDA